MSNKDTLLYLVSKLGSNSEGRKKIMKMMFLVNHFDVNKNSLVKTPFLKEDFIIYHYGVFSFEVMDNFLDLSNEGKVKGDYPVDIKTSDVPNIPSKTKERVDLIVEKFGNKDGKELEKDTLGMLNLNLETKRQHFGESIASLIR